VQYRMLPLLAALVGCGGATASVEGTAGDVSWGSTDFVYFGARYIVISAAEIDCRDIDWVNRNYDEGVAPTDLDVTTLQFTFTSGDSVAQGRFPVAEGGQVTSTIVNVSGDVFHEYNASAGTLQVDAAEEDGTATGSFDSVTFEDGSITGTFTAEWCVNLKS